MLILITSPGVIASPSRPPSREIIDALISIKKKGTPVAVLSNKPKPEWFDYFFHNSGVVFHQEHGRQSGNIIKKISHHYKTPTYNILVLAGSDTDIQMAKNSNSVLLGSSWSSDKVKDLGIKIETPEQINSVIELVKGWNGDWWFKSDNKKYSVRALMDLSGYGKNEPQVNFSKALTKTIKQGGEKLAALLITISRSLLIDKTDKTKDLFWAVYPSSACSISGDAQTLSEFTHRLRTTVSKVRFSKADEPLFIRHSDSEKRSSNRSASRTDPANQITTLYLNPYYRKQIKKRNVILIDDCTTYGLSFGVATAFLLKAGASSVKCIALGKFGNAINYFDIEILSDPFNPVKPDGFRIIETHKMIGVSDQNRQEVLLNIIQ